MLISLDWLKQYVDIKENINDLEHALTMIGQEVEAVEVQGENLNNIVVGKVIEKGQHPDADKLSLCKVDIGEENPLQIVCGAPNHKQGDKVVVAKIGAILPGDFKIKKAKVRGLESSGMMCSEKELGMSEENEGIMILSEEAKIGISIKDYLEQNDVIFELEITPNRPDCLSHIGIAREVAAYYERDLRYPESSINETSEKTSDSIEVKIENKELCKRYATRVVKGVKIGESPAWLKRRLQAIGLRSINNVVDITNFILMESGHPMHAFDYNKIAGKKIIVRNAYENEKLTTLDGEERELDTDTLVIADSEKAVAIGGVIGGGNSEVTDETTDLLLEVACFTTENIRKTGKKYTISTDSSYRFERGINIEDTEAVINRAAKLIQELAGGEILEGIVEEYVEAQKENEVVFTIDKFNRFFGKNVEKEKMISILTNLEMKVEDLGNGKLKVIAPIFRQDIHRVADVYEEIARMYGFENVEDVMPIQNIKPGKISAEMTDIDMYKDLLAELGLQEVINYSFIPQDAGKKIGIDIETVSLMNPINEEMVMMRPTTLYSLLTNLRDNFNRNIFDIKIFEVSRVFQKSDQDLPNEPVKIGIALGGRSDKQIWDAKPANYDFYDIKGYVESMCEVAGLKRYSLKRSESKLFHPGRSADICMGRDILGSFGEVHPDVMETMGLKERVYLAELDMEKINKYSNNKIKYKLLVKFPAVGRDLAVVMPEDSLVGEMISAVSKLSDLIEKVDLFDVYTGEQVEKGFKSVALNIQFRSPKGTLNEDEINKLMDKVLKTIEKKYNGTIRS